MVMIRMLIGAAVAARMLAVKCKGVKRFFEAERVGGEDAGDLGDHVLDTDVILTGDFEVAVKSGKLLDEQVHDVVRHFVRLEIQFIAHWGRRDTWIHLPLENECLACGGRINRRAKNSPKKIFAFSAMLRISSKCWDRQWKLSIELRAKTSRAALQIEQRKEREMRGNRVTNGPDP